MDEIWDPVAASWGSIKSAAHSSCGQSGFVDLAHRLGEVNVPDVRQVLRETGSCDCQEVGSIIEGEAGNLTDWIYIGEIAVQVLANSWNSIDSHVHLRLCLVGPQHLERDWLVEDVGVGVWDHSLTHVGEGLSCKGVVVG